jgi:glucosamine 6-phosphate synthetase-like amidotransferase/phosphosugar isomerase protein
VFGFIATGHRGPDLSRLRTLAVANASRGEDAFGLVWMRRDGSLHTFKRAGSILKRLDAIERVADAQVVFGHCRWATPSSGSPAEAENNHPHPSGRGFIVHNGHVRNHRFLSHVFSLRLRGECDSEVLGRLIAALPGKLERRARTALLLSEGPQAVLGIWSGVTPRLLIARRGKPLHLSRQKGGVYLGSLSIGLGGQVEAVDDNTVSGSAVDSWLRPRQRGLLPDQDQEAEAG